MHAADSDRESSIEFLTDGQLCDRLHITPRTTLRWRRDGGGPPFVRAGERRVLYRLEDVVSWERAHTFTHRAAEATARKP
jgi:hypothetical protein